MGEKRASEKSLLSLFIVTGILFLIFAGDKITAASKITEKIYSPIRLTFGPANNLLVSDYLAKSIVTVDRKRNKILKRFKIDGMPLGIAYHKGKIFVGNATRRSVEVYLESGRMKYSFDTRVRQPNDIVIDESGGRVYVVDTFDKNVKVFSIEGNFLFRFPNSSTVHPLVNPTAVAFDKKNNFIYVSDYGDSARWIYPSVRIFDMDGNIVGEISGKLGMFGNRFSRPQGLVVDENGYVFLVDCFSGEILVFTGLTGMLVKTISGYGTEDGKMRLPLDLVIDPKSKDIFVTNNRGAKIEIFRAGGEL
ncbi:MAG: NHL repeat-containing protein [Acidobacteriota bacterium]